MSNRKQHSGEAGYIAERTNPYVPGKKVVIYEAAAQGIDTGGTRYAVVCDAHASTVGDTSLPRARESMKFPDLFCEGCRALTEYAAAYMVDKAGRAALARARGESEAQG